MQDEASCQSRPQLWRHTLGMHTAPQHQCMEMHYGGDDQLQQKIYNSHLFLFTMKASLCEPTANNFYVQKSAKCSMGDTVHIFYQRNQTDFSMENNYILLV